MCTMQGCSTCHNVLCELYFHSSAFFREVRFSCLSLPVKNSIFIAQSSFVKSDFDCLAFPYEYMLSLSLCVISDFCCLASLCDIRFPQKTAKKCDLCIDMRNELVRTASSFCKKRVVIPSNTEKELLAFNLLHVLYESCPVLIHTSSYMCIFCLVILFILLKIQRSDQTLSQHQMKLCICSHLYHIIPYGTNDSDIGYESNCDMNYLYLSWVESCNVRISSVSTFLSELTSKLIYLILLTGGWKEFYNMCCDYQDSYVKENKMLGCVACMARWKVVSKFCLQA